MITKKKSIEVQSEGSKIVVADMERSLIKKTE